MAVVGLMILTVVVPLILIFFMPDQVAAHFDLAGNVDRIGSRYEHLVLPAFSVILGVGLLFAAKFGDQDNRKLMAKLAIVVQAFMLVLSVVFCVNALISSPATTVGSNNSFISKICFIVLGVMLIVFGFLMPKASRNSAFGIRTPWTFSSEEVWTESQKFGGQISILMGIFMIAAQLVLDGTSGIIAFVVLFVVWAVIALVGSYRIYRRITRAHQKQHKDSNGIKTLDIY